MIKPGRFAIPRMAVTIVTCPVFPPFSSEADILRLYFILFHVILFYFILISPINAERQQKSTGALGTSACMHGRGHGLMRSSHATGRPSV